MSYHIKIDETVPLQYRDKVESWLHNAIDFLVSIPRTQSLPAIDTLIPDFSKLKYTICDHFNPPHGLFSRIAWTGYSILPLRDNGVLRLQTEPRLIEFPDQDVELATMVSWVHLFDQMFYTHRIPDQHLAKQLMYLEQHSPALHKEATRKIRADGVKRRNAARRQGKPITQEASSAPTAIKQDSKSSCHLPQFNPSQVAAPQLVTAPTPELSEYQERVIAEHRAMWECVREKMDDQTDTCKS